jgi:quercetin dioxygenase-like cupin family protein
LLGALVAALCHTIAQAQSEPAGFVVTLPDKLNWAPNPAVPGAVAAVLAGNPGKPETYVVRVKFPDAYRVMPHTHPDQRTYTIISGNFQIGIGEKFDESKLQPAPAGAVYILPPNVPHFHLTKGETIIQYSAVGPTGLAFVNPADDPRKK